MVQALDKKEIRATLTGDASAGAQRGRAAGDQERRRRQASPATPSAASSSDAAQLAFRNDAFAAALNPRRSASWRATLNQALLNPAQASKPSKRSTRQGPHKPGPC
jgi:hypothetical protein